MTTVSALRLLHVFHRHGVLTTGVRGVIPVVARDHQHRCPRLVDHIRNVIIEDDLTLALVVVRHLHQVADVAREGLHAEGGALDSAARGQHRGKRLVPRHGVEICVAIEGEEVLLRRLRARSSTA
jgi:hypothetical protein